MVSKAARWPFQFTPAPVGAPMGEVMVYKSKDPIKAIPGHYLRNCKEAFRPDTQHCQMKTSLFSSSSVEHNCRRLPQYRVLFSYAHPPASPGALWPCTLDQQLRQLATGLHVAELRNPALQLTTPKVSNEFAGRLRLHQPASGSGCGHLSS